jgi:uncharacterized protein
MNLTKVIFILLGTITLVVGVSGIFIPGLPATPFLLLAAGLYSRSSEFLYNKLTDNSVIGVYIKNFKMQKGMPVKLKLFSIILMWIMISASCLFFINSEILIMILIVLGLTGTLVMGFIIPTVPVKKI